MDNIISGSTENKFKCVVRVSSTYFSLSDTLVYQRKVRVLKRKSIRYGKVVLEEECSSIDVESLLGSIVNFNDCEDGLYLLEYINVSYDHESGFVDDYDFKLMPYEGD